MLGKGSINHNNRKFIASNVDKERTSSNTTYCDVPIKVVYHTLFDDAVERYNAKQTRTDRCIDNYYEKICTGKQEKPFYEVIYQIGNCENMSSRSKESILAHLALNDFMKHFQERNPQLYVFSAHLHLDEATPHLHVDFVPFTSGSKRGLDTRVSLKQALAAQGFSGGSRGDTEWSQWVKSEKEQLAHTMELYGIEWEQLGTHDEHLSVLDFKKVQRKREVADIEKEISEKTEEIQGLQQQKQHVNAELVNVVDDLKQVQSQLKTVKDVDRAVEKYMKQMNEDPDLQLPEPKPLMSARAYYEKVAVPVVEKMKAFMRSVVFRLFGTIQRQQIKLNEVSQMVKRLSQIIIKNDCEIMRLMETEAIITKIKNYLGDETYNIIKSSNANTQIMKEHHDHINVDIFNKSLDR